MEVAGCQQWKVQVRVKAMGRQERWQIRNVERGGVDVGDVGHIFMGWMW